MLRKTIITSIFTLSILFAFGQDTDLHKLDGSKILQYKIKMIDVWKIQCDSIGKPIDILIYERSSFDTTGRLNVKQWGYTHDGKGWCYTFYFYNDKGSLDHTEIHSNGHPAAGIVNRAWCDGKEPSYYWCYKYEKCRIVEKIKYYSDNPNTIIEKFEYEYNEMGLLSITRKYFNGILSEIERIDYLKDEK
jgi:hypothetical protein